MIAGSFDVIEPVDRYACYDFYRACGFLRTVFRCYRDLACACLYACNLAALIDLRNCRICALPCYGLIVCFGRDDRCFELPGGACVNGEICFIKFHACD